MRTGQSSGHRIPAGVMAPWICALLLVSPALLAQEPADPARALKSKLVSERLAAVEALRISADPQNEKLLLGALADRDWEVIERAAIALGDRGADPSIGPLIKLCTEGPILRLRRSAAKTLARIAPFKGTAELAKLAGGKSAARALEALAIVARASADGSAGAAIQRGLKSKERNVRLAAALAIASLPPEQGDEALATILGSDDAELSATALDAVAASAETHFIPGLLGAIHGPEVPDVLERRLLAACVVCLGNLDELGRPAQSAKQLESFTQLGPLSGAQAEARAVRLYASIATAAVKDSPLAGAVVPLLVAGLSNSQATVRKAAVAGVMRSGIAEGRDAVLSMAAKDPDGGVRALALRESARVLGAKDPALFAVLTECIANDGQPAVREAAAVALGVGDLPGAAIALARGLNDADWAVATCAAVSLGKTRDPVALEPLAALLAHADWRYRASATVGLCALMHKEALPALIRALGDKDPSVRRVAFVFLEQQFKAGLPEERAPWEAWWKENAATARLIDSAAEKARRERYGYATGTAEAFENLDVVVLESDGDHIQRLLERLKIAWRPTQASKLLEAALQPGAVYVSNCTGEIETRDVERIAWFVRAGGMLAGSCWSLNKTIERVHPGIVRKLETASEVLDDVLAHPADPSSPYLKDVFGGDNQPLYNLLGAHLIEVLEPESCEVLIDSPQALEHWGGGNLAVSFHSGHGRILDSANHFELQGLEVAQGLKTAADRMEFAFDHLNLDYATWRSTKDEKWWDNSLRASQHIFDDSALKFVTNFVRAKRLSDG